MYLQVDLSCTSRDGADAGERSKRPVTCAVAAGDDTGQLHSPLNRPVQRRARTRRRTPGPARAPPRSRPRPATTPALPCCSSARTGRRRSPKRLSCRVWHCSLVNPLARRSYQRSPASPSVMAGRRLGQFGSGSARWLVISAAGGGPEPGCLVLVVASGPAAAWELVA